MLVHPGRSDGDRMVSAAEWVGIDRLWHACPTCGVQIQKCRSFIAHMHQAMLASAAVQHAIASVRFQKCQF